MKRTYIIITHKGSARVFLNHTIEMFATQVSEMVVDWNEVIIWDLAPAEWPQWIFRTSDGHAHPGFGLNRGRAIQKFLQESYLHGGFTVYPVVSVCPGENVSVQVVDPNNPSNLHLVPEPGGT